MEFILTLFVIVLKNIGLSAIVTLYDTDLLMEIGGKPVLFIFWIICIIVLCVIDAILLGAGIIIANKIRRLVKKLKIKRTRA